MSPRHAGEAGAMYMEGLAFAVLGTRVHGTKEEAI